MKVSERSRTIEQKIFNLLIQLSLIGDKMRIAQRALSKYKSPCSKRKSQQFEKEFDAILNKINLLELQQFQPIEINESSTIVN